MTKATVMAVNEGATGLVISKSLIGQANDLAREHEQFNDRYIVAGRLALYELLTKIYELVERFDAASDKSELLQMVRKSLFEDYGIRTQDNSTDTGILVRYITRADRKTTHVYARAIETARSEGVRPKYLAKYLERKGGVERIRAEAAKLPTVGLPAIANSEESLGDLSAEKSQLRDNYLEARKESPYTSFTVSKSSNDLPTPEPLNFFVCSEKNGRYFVLAQLPLSKDLQKEVMQELTESLTSNFAKAKVDVERFHQKSMRKHTLNLLNRLRRNKKSNPLNYSTTSI
ncbi:hypothetical protein [Polynucleobacter sinensis]|uniref:hypothetical protein n=1 Tax=Polynucleobacter sinensis TaxID=1743157 RepID=UPI0007834538|nr:hypothetical protein [Polynucleobacter sinensis]